MAHLADRLQDRRQIGLDVHGDQIGPGRHDLARRAFAQLQHVLDHLLLFFIHGPFHPVLLEVFEELLLPFLLLLFRRRGRHPGQPAHEAVVELQDVDNRGRHNGKYEQDAVGAADQLLARVLRPRVRNRHAEHGEDRQGDDEHEKIGSGVQPPMPLGHQRHQEQQGPDIEYQPVEPAGHDQPVGVGRDLLHQLRPLLAVGRFELLLQADAREHPQRIGTGGEERRRSHEQTRQQHRPTDKPHVQLLFSYPRQARTAIPAEPTVPAVRYYTPIHSLNVEESHPRSGASGGPARR